MGRPHTRWEDLVKKDVIVLGGGSDGPSGRLPEEEEYIYCTRI